MEVIVARQGGALVGFDCRDVVGVEDAEGGGIPGSGAVRLRLGRRGHPRTVAGLTIVGFFRITARELRPVPWVLRERMTGEIPWGVALILPGICLLY